MTKPTVTLMIGMPGTGKSTYVKQRLAEQPDLFVYSTDDIIESRAAAQGLTYNDVFEDHIDEAFRTVDALQEQAVADRRDIIRDQTNLGAGVRRRAVELFEPCGYSIHAVYFKVTDEAEWRRRLASRPNKIIGEEALGQMQGRFAEPEHHEGFDRITVKDMAGNTVKVSEASGAELRAARLAAAAAEKRQAIEQTAAVVADRAAFAEIWQEVWGLPHGEGEPLPNREIPNWIKQAGAGLEQRFAAEIQAAGLEWSDIGVLVTRELVKYFKEAN